MAAKAVELEMTLKGHTARVEELQSALQTAEAEGKAREQHIEELNQQCAKLTSQLEGAVTGQPEMEQGLQEQLEAAQEATVQAKAEVADRVAEITQLQVQVMEAEAAKAADAGEAVRPLLRSHEALSLLIGMEESDGRGR